MKSHEQAHIRDMKAGQALRYLTCEKCGSITEPKDRPKSRRWVCTNEECGCSVVEK